ncbi:30S ribosomal protein S17 [Candidatus Parcubacteria bacterium]|jgi:small subunit ribosomal protein S17|nr:MAG: 30S ribosomal protein S17 [Candidatus Parcubacteria bacterium]
MSENSPKEMQRTFSGTVVSTKMQKTLAVRVDRVLVHSKYGKRFVSSKKYLVDAPTGKFEVGQKVEFAECRPLSRRKRWRVITRSEK